MIVLYGRHQVLTPIPQVKVNLGGRARVDEDGNVVPGRMVDMVVEGSNVFIVSAVV